MLRQCWQCLNLSSTSSFSEGCILPCSVFTNPVSSVDLEPQLSPSFWKPWSVECRQLKEKKGQGKVMITGLHMQQLSWWRHGRGQVQPPVTWSWPFSPVVYPAHHSWGLCPFPSSFTVFPQHQCPETELPAEGNLTRTEWHCSQNYLQGRNS